MLSPLIENFPGFPKGVLTNILIDKFKEQVDELNVPILSEEAIGINSDNQLPAQVYTVTTTENSYKTRSIIIATGASPKRMGVLGEEKFIGKGVSYCAVCDAPFFKNKEILVVGAGDRALEEAIFLTAYASRVTLVHRRQQMRASKILEEKARQNSKINFIVNSVIEEIQGKERVEKVLIKNVLNSEVTVYPCQGVFIFIGIKPNTKLAINQPRLDESGFIITGQDMKTSLNGVYACGDCCKKTLYQVINACGEAAVAADSARKYLLNLNLI